MDLENGQTVSQIAAHDQPIRSVRFFTAPQTNSEMVVTGSWDNTIKYWDMRSPTAVVSVDMRQKVYTLDVQKNVLVVGTAERFIQVIDLQQPDKIKKTIQSPLKWQTRVVSLFPDATGFAVGSIEGRCAIQYVEDKDAR
jgi:mRNA export factor